MTYSWENSFQGSDKKGVSMKQWVESWQTAYLAAGVVMVHAGLEHRFKNFIDGAKLESKSLEEKVKFFNGWAEASLDKVRLNGRRSVEYKLADEAVGTRYYTTTVLANKHQFSSQKHSDGES